MGAFNPGDILMSGRNAVQNVLAGRSPLDNGGQKTPNLVTTQAPGLKSIDDPMVRKAADIERQNQQLGRTRRSTFITGQAAAPSAAPRQPRRTLLGG